MISLAADVGGTFTDVVLVDSATGLSCIDKVPSTPGSTAAIVAGIESLAGQAGIEPADIDVFIHGFTIATNAWLTRTGARTVLATTRGFRDLLEIATQRRPLAYSLTQHALEPLVPRSRVIEVDERIDAFGNVVTPLDATEARRVAAAVAQLAPESIVVSFVFSHLNPAHEQMLAAAIAELLPDVPLYIGSKINPQVEEYPRTNATVTTAYVGPAVDRYVGALERALPAMGMTAPLMLMRSDGGIATSQAARENPGTMLLSGPAGGVMAGLETSRSLDVPELITFDMGGTSADFSLIDGGAARMVNERVVGGTVLRLPSLDIQTISAGGGSIGSVDLGGAIRVGPESAGSVPGPACYGRGGTRPTLTDAAVAIGMLAPDEYLGGAMQLNAALARAAIDEHVARPLGLAIDEAAYAMVAIANSHMALAVRSLSVERGYDVRRFALLSFGGAGPLFAPFLARDLEMREIIVPTRPGVFSASGLLLSDVRYAYQAPLLSPIESAEAGTVRERFAQLAREAEERFVRDGIGLARRTIGYALDVRYSGQVHELTLPLPVGIADGWWEPAAIAAQFHRAHETAYGFADAAQPCEIVNLRLEAIGTMPKGNLRPSHAATRAAASTASPAASSTTTAAPRQRKLYLGPEVGDVTASVHRRENLLPGTTLQGPAIIVQLDTTTLVLPGQSLTVAAQGELRISTR